ncbi:hypothetical protein COCOBI_10-0610 [Coccomyxa sp. Obi]|nr:hypothetical protein COCOBI_10-0610 [Coccomyxa sp. Obi]
MRDPEGSEWKLALREGRCDVLKNIHQNDGAWREPLLFCCVSGRLAERGPGSRSANVAHAAMAMVPADLIEQIMCNANLIAAD